MHRINSIGSSDKTRGKEGTLESRNV